MKTVDKIKLLEELKEATSKGILEAGGKWFGLCAIICDSLDTPEYWNRVATISEVIYLKSILPKKRDDDGYCWGPGLKAPRIEFINKKIAQLKKRLK